MKRNSSDHQQFVTRRGSLLVETIVAAMILGATISMLVPAMTAVRHQRQAHRFESLAIVELNNIAEFLPPASETAQSPALSDWFSARYSRARLDVEILPEAADTSIASLQAVRLTIHQPTFQSVAEQKVSIVVWRPVQEETP